MPVEKWGIVLEVEGAEKFFQVLAKVTDIWTDLGESIQDRMVPAVDQLNNVLDRMDSEVQRLPPVLDDTVSSADDLGKSTTSLAGGGLSAMSVAVGNLTADLVRFVVSGIGKAVGAMNQLVQSAAKMEGVEIAFRGLGSTMEKGAAGMLRAMEKASSGMIAQSELMLQFNRGAALVSRDFAEKLPEAMGFLSKTAAATGADLNFMLDSLVLGIGRLSPKILDNLQIQIRQAEITARVASEFGKTAETATQAEQQMAAMSLVLEKLAANTANMSDVSATAAANMARVQAQGANIAQQFGRALLPAWTALTAAGSDIVSRLAEMTEEGGVLFPIIVNLGATLSLAADGLADLATNAFDAISNMAIFGDVLEFLTGDLLTTLPRQLVDMATVTEEATSSVAGSFSRMADSASGGFKEAGDVMAEEAQESSQSALEWGVDLVASYSSGIIQGVSTVLVTAMNAISNMLVGWLSPSSPPQIMPTIFEDGLAAMNMYLSGMTSADFDVLEDVQGILSQILEPEEFADASEQMIAALSEGGIAGAFTDIAVGAAGELGEALAVLIKREEAVQAASTELTAIDEQLVLAQEEAATAAESVAAIELVVADATKKVQEAEEALEASRNQSIATQDKVSEETKEYNRLLREGADKATLDAQLARVNAAEKERNATVKNVLVQQKQVDALADIEDAAKDELAVAKDVEKVRSDDLKTAKAAAKDELKFAKDQLKLQQRLLKQLLQIEKAREQAAKEEAAREAGVAPDAVVPGGAVVIPELPKPSFPQIDLRSNIAKAIDLAKLGLGEKFATLFKPITDVFSADNPALVAIREAFAGLAEQARLVWEEKLVPFWDETLKPALEKIGAFIQGNFIPILLGIGAMVLMFVIPPFVAWAAASLVAAAATLAALAPVVLPILAIGAAVTLVAMAWQNDWGGIRTFMVKLWDDKLQPIFEAIGEWFEEKIPEAIEAVSLFWTETLVPAMEEAGDWIEETLLPLLEELWEWLGTTLTEVLTTLGTFWEETLLPAMTAVWKWLDGTLIPLFVALAELLEVASVLAVETLTDIWENTLQPALEVVWKFMKEDLWPIIQAGIDVITDLTEDVGGGLQPVFEAINTFLQDTLLKTWNTLNELIKKITDRIVTFTDKLKKLKAPPVMDPGSPSPFELALRGINTELERMADRNLPKVRFGFDALPGSQAMANPVAGTAQFGDRQEISNVSQSININFGPTTISGTGADLDQVAQTLRRVLRDTG